MKRITKPHQPREEKHIFTEGIDYSKTGEESIWGRGDPDTLKLLSKEKISRKWLNLAAGDGRYNLQLLEKADSVVASDIDESALNKLYHNTPAGYKARLETRTFDIAEPFPLDDFSFDGVFCMGTLHLFPRAKLEEIVRQMDRVLKPNGKIILDFATDIRRVRPDGTLYVRNGEPQYTLNGARNFLKEIFKDYKVRMYNSKVPEEKTRDYTFSCNFVLLVAEKKK